MESGTIEKSRVLESALVRGLKLGWPYDNDELGRRARERERERERDLICNQVMRSPWTVQRIITMFKPHEKTQFLPRGCFIRCPTSSAIQGIFWSAACKAPGFSSFVTDATPPLSRRHSGASEDSQMSQAVSS